MVILAKLRLPSDCFFLALAVVLVASFDSALCQTAAKPNLHRRIPHPLAEAGAGPPQAGSSHGWVMATGKTGVVSVDSLDDLVIASMNEDFTFGSQMWADVGALYTYVDANLEHHDQHFQLLPSVLEDEAQIGRLAMVVADVRGTATSPQNQLVFAPCHASVQTCSGQPVPRGAVDVFDLTASQPTPPPPDPSPAFKLRILPPAYDNGYGDPQDDQESEPDTCHIRWFGHSIASGDVDGDGHADLIVGAPATYENGDLAQAHGRVYVFFGHPNFLSAEYPPGSGRPGYKFRWLAIKAPQTLPANPDRFLTQGTFGISVAAGDIDLDGKCDVLAGRHERYSPPAAGPGRAHLFSGSYLADIGPGASGGNRLEVPLPPTDIDTGVPGAYETLVDPAGRSGGWFGWIVYTCNRDLGGPGFGTAESRPDVAVHSENADYIVNGNIVTAGVGSLQVFFGNSDISEPPVSLVDEAGFVRLQTPLNSGLAPQHGERFGRSAVDVEWRNTFGQPVTGILVAATDRDFPTGPHTSIQDAGCVFFFQAPLDGPAGKDNAWGTFVLKEPRDVLLQGPGTPINSESDMQPQAFSVFGRMLVKLRYNSTLVGDQVAVAGSERDLQSTSKVGQVYTLHVGGQ